MTVQLYPHQISAVSQAVEIVKRNGFVYFNCEPRTGKTLMSLRLAEILQRKHVLVIAPLRTHRGWDSDYSKLSVKYKLTVINPESLHKLLDCREITQMKGVKKSVPGVNGKPEIVYIKEPVTVKRYFKRLSDTYDFVIIDEAHGFGAAPKQSKASQLAKIICQGLPISLLSGTPAPETTSQWYYQITMCTHPRATVWRQYQTFYRWARDYVIERKIPIGCGRYISDYTQCREDKVAQDIAPLCVTVKQKDLEGFLQVNEEFVFARPHAEIGREIRAYINDNVGQISLPNGSILDLQATSAVEKAQTVHQLCSGTIIHGENRYVVFDDKAVALKPYSVDGKKLAIYYHYVAEEQMVRSVFGGRITTDAHEFEASPDKVFLGHVRAAREGINLSTATHIAILTPPWSHTSYAQIMQRANLMGRTAPCILLWVVSDFLGNGDGLEMRIINSVRNKKVKMSEFVNLIEGWNHATKRT